MQLDTDLNNFIEPTYPNSSLSLQPSQGIQIQSSLSLGLPPNEEDGLQKILDDEDDVYKDSDFPIGRDPEAY